jgi:pimeloyl-ACP methyl ester carboxylesterase
MRPIFCISGLGADERIFSRLRVPGFKLVCLPWITPLHDEPIRDYACRMLAPVSDVEPIFLGVSFGGMMAIEMARQMPTAKVILVSSIRHHEELPAWMKLSGKLRLNRLIPGKPPPWLSPLENFFLGAETPEEVVLCNEFRQNVDPAYLHWAISQVLHWKNEWQPTQCFQLHGDRDRIFPVQQVRPTHIVPGGGHLMISNRAEEVSRILMRICA